MANNPITVRTSVTIRASQLTYNWPFSSGYTLPLTNQNGPIPGYLLVPTHGVNLVLTGLVSPRLCAMVNLDPNNYIDYGPYDPEGGSLADNFVPVWELPPGSVPIVQCFSSLFAKEYGTGTGTALGSKIALRLKARTVACGAIINVFDR